MGGIYSTNGRHEKYILARKPTEKRIFGKSLWRWYNIEMDLAEVDWEGWSGFVWLRTRTSGGLLPTP